MSFRICNILLIGIVLLNSWLDHLARSAGCRGRFHRFGQWLPG